MMKKSAVLIAITLMLAASCQLFVNPDAQNPAGDGPGRTVLISVSIPDRPTISPLSLTPHSVSVTATRSGFQDVTANLTWNGSVYQGNLNISAGEWLVSAGVYDSYGVLIYSGQSLVDTATSGSLHINLAHECGALKITTDPFPAGTMDTFRVTASRSDFDSVTVSTEIGADDTGASAYVLNLTSGTWNVRLSLINDGAVYYDYTYAVEVVTNELTERTLPITPFQSKVLPVQFTPATGVIPDGGSVGVTLSCATSGAQIRYTTDGQNPTRSEGNFYSGQTITIQWDNPKEIKAIAYVLTGGLSDSDVTSIWYKPELPAVEFSLDSGTYQTAQTVALTCPTTADGVSIYYRTDGGDFGTSSGTLYSGEITVDQSMQLTAIARKVGYHDSPVASREYILRMPQVVFTPSGGTFSTAQTVTLTCSDPGDGIYYTTNGDYPSEAYGTLYSAPFTIDQDTTVRAAAVRSGWDLAPVEAEFSIFLVPTLSSPSGTINDTTPLLDWGDVPSAESYQVRYVPSSDVTNIDQADVYATTGAESEFQIATELDVDTEYSWQVQAVKSDRSSDWSSIGTFTIQIDGGITVVPHNPVIDLSLNVEDGSLEIVEGSTRTVTASTDPVSDSFQWYLDGVVIDGETAASIAIGEALIGDGEEHTVTVIASTADAMASESFTVSVVPLEIGVIYEGGIVFYLDGSGGGLVCAESDQGTSIQWGGYFTEVGGTSTAVGTGAANTAAIVAAYGENEPYSGLSNYAAKLCDDLVLNGYEDWFLPSKDELNLMYENLHDAGLGGFASENYWSSSENGSSGAWNQRFDNGIQGPITKYSNVRVRAARAFNY